MRIALIHALAHSVEPINAEFDRAWPEAIRRALARYGSGCTSGHGVCGLSRMSPRSLVATLSFMAAGFITCRAGGGEP